MKAISLLPAATEIVAALGLLDRLHGVSHECDFPPAAALLPRVTHCPIHGGALESGEVDRWVRETLESSGTLYRLDEALVRRIAPDLVLTQALCDVCAVDYGSVREFAKTLPGPPAVLSLDPSTLEEVVGDFERVARAFGEPERAGPVVAGLRARVEAVRAAAAAAASRPRCFVLEWTDPVYAAGHWNPELVALAGGEEVLGRTGEDSRRVPWEEVLASAPEVIVLACCGYPAERTMKDVPALRARPGWADLPAVRAGRVYVVDANAYFSRPGPRLVDSLEILAEVLHPEVFGGRYPDRGVLRVTPS
jgi:iron complex transport system substrate-binding protein